MKWNYDRIQASVSTLTDDLGREYDVDINMEQDVEEDPVNPSTDGYRNFRIRPGSQHVTITIYPKGTIRHTADFALK